MSIQYHYNIRNEVVSAQSNTTNNYTNFPKHKSFRTRIKQVVTVSLIFLSMVTGEVFAGDKLPKSKANASKKKESTFGAIHLSSALPDVVPQLPLPDLIPSNPPVTPPPMPPLPDIVPPVILPDVVPVPPAPSMASSMPDLVSDATPQIKQKSGFLAAMKEIAKGNFKLKKVKQEPKTVLVSSDNIDLMSQLHNTLERRRKGIAGEKQNKQFKEVAKQVIVLTVEEQKAREAEIARKIAENKEKAATLRKQKEKEWAIKAKQIEAEVEIEKQRRAAEHVKAMREQKAKERVGDSSTVIAGIDPVLHNNMVADLRQEISSLKDQLTLKGNVTAGAINDLDLNDHARSKRSLEDTRIVETKDQSTSTEDLIILEDRLYDEKLENWGFEEEEAVKKLDEVISKYSASDSGYDDEALEDSSIASSISSSDTNVVISEEELQSKPIVSEIVQDQLVNVEKELQSQKLKEEEEVEAVEDILGEDLITDTRGSPADANNSTARHQEVLAERTRFAARVREDLRFGSKMLSKQIRHRLLTRDIGSLVAVSAGDEEQEQAPSYSVWSSGIFGGSKQKAISTALGYSSRIHGGSIGGEINLSSDLMFGVSGSVQVIV